PFDLGQGVVVRKTCSVGWAPFPWCRENYGAICAEEVIELADAALYRAKAAGRNQGVGILPGRTSIAAARSITLRDIQNDRGELTQIVTVPNAKIGEAVYKVTQELGRFETPRQPESSKISE